MKTENERAPVSVVSAPQGASGKPGLFRHVNAAIHNSSLLRTDTLLLPYLALFLAVMGMGSSAIFIKWANMPGSVFGFYRMVIAITLSGAFFHRQAKRTTLSRPHLWLALLAGLGLACDLWLWNDAVLNTSAANANLFGNTSVIWVAIGAMVIFKERLRPAFWAGLVIALLGMAVILGQDFIAHHAFGFGDLMSILASLFYTVFFLATARARDGLSAFMAWWLSSLSSAVALLMISLAFQRPLAGYSLQTYACIFAVAILTQIGGYLSVNYALGRLPPSMVSLILLASPVITALLGVPLLGQSITWEQIVGGLLVLGGILIVHRTRQVVSPRPT
jgi:drug/metabolite transporter (DMT)-like permease